MLCAGVNIASGYTRNAASEKFTVVCVADDEVELTSSDVG